MLLYLFDSKQAAFTDFSTCFPWSEEYTRGISYSTCLIPWLLALTPIWFEHLYLVMAKCQYSPSPEPVYYCVDLTLRRLKRMSGCRFTLLPLQGRNNGPKRQRYAFCCALWGGPRVWCLLPRRCLLKRQAMFHAVYGGKPDWRCLSWFVQERN